jgi:MFS family permease
MRPWQQPLPLRDMPSRAYARYVLAVLTVMYTFNYLDRYVLTILVGHVKAELVLSDTVMGFLLGPAFALFYTALGIPIARLADRHSRRFILTVSFVLWSLMTAAAGVARTGTQLAITRVLVGVGEAGGAAPAHSLIADYFPPHRRALAFGVFQQGVYLGQLLGLAVGGVLVGTIGWRATFVAVGLPGVLVAWLLYATVSEPRRGAFEIAPPLPGGDEPSIGTVLRRLWAIKSFRGVALGAGIASFAGTGFGFWVPTLFARVHGMSMADVGLTYGPVTAISASAGALLAGALTDRLSRRDVRWLAWIPALSVVGSLPFLVGMCLVESAAVAVALAVPSGLIGGGWAPAAYAAVQRLAPPTMRALAASLTILFITLLGMGLGPQAIGILNDLLAPRFGIDAVRWSMVAVLSTCLVGGWLLAWAGARLRIDLPEEPA